MPRRQPRTRDHEQLQARQHREQELTQAQSQAQSRGQQESPLIDMREEEAEELLDRLRDVDLDSDEYEDLEAILKPYLSSLQMLANHGTDYYGDRANRLLGENLADRIILGRERGRLCTGVFRQIAQDVDGDGFPGERTRFSQLEREAIRQALADVRTSQKSLGDGKFLDALTDIHVSSEVKRESHTDDTSSSGGVFSSLLGG